MKRSTECERIEELMPGYIDGGLSDVETAEVSSHLSKCASCPEALESFRELESSLSSLKNTLPDPRRVADSLAGRLGLEKRRRLSPVFSRISLIWSFAVAAAALILLVSRVDYVSALMSGQESFIESAAATLNYWVDSTSGVIAEVLSQGQLTINADPWVLTFGMLGFGLLVFAGGIMAALKTLR
jgi:anti-sigma factor RsiW